MRKQTKHTPGPWYPPHFAREDTTCQCGHIFSEHQQHMGAVCTVRWDKSDLGFDAQKKSEAIANAHLIASAPEMYEALDRLIRIISSDDPWDRERAADMNDACDAALSALRKARGQST